MNDSVHPAPRAPEDLAGRRVTVIGLGRFGGGVGVTRWLCGQGAEVTVSDKAGADELEESLVKLDGLDVTFHLGEHRESDFLDADLLVVNPAVPPDLPPLAAARAAGVPRTTEINLFIERCSAPIAGVTGSVGKSTTTAMTGAILSRRYTTHVGGNIGRSLLESLPDIRPDHVVVLELSSFQLVDLPLIRISPHVAVVTNLTANHLDRHGTMEAYAAAKKNIFAFQGPRDVLILNSDDRIVSAWKDEAPGKVDWFSRDDEPFELSLPGGHNQANAQAAWAAGRQFGVERASAAEALATFTGLPHRLEFVVERDGVRYYNDSKCTTPDGAIVALNAFPSRQIVVILGGYDKGAGFEKLGIVAASRAKAVVVLGATAEAIASSVEAYRSGGAPVIERAADLASAVALCRQHACEGDAVLLSPACASYDMFVNYEDRGQQFCGLVRTE